VAALTVVAAPMLLATSAWADVPEGWSNPEPVDGRHVLLVLVGIPVALFVVITLLVMAPSFAKGERGTLASGESEWFGGPRKGIDELEAAPAEKGETGGARGRW